MFDPQKWILQSWNDDDTKMVKIAGEEMKIRRLKGTQFEHYARASAGNEESAVAVVLQYGLVKGFGQYSYAEMLKFYDHCPVMADQIAAAILDHTMQRMQAEKQVLEDAEKNSEATLTPPPSGDGAENMVETHNPQE